MIIGRPASLMTNEGPNWRESPSALSAHTRTHAHAREPQAKFHQYTHLRPAGIDAARPHSSRGSGLRRIRATGRPTSRLTISSWFRVLHTLPHVLTYGFDQCLRRRRRRRRLNGDSLIVLFGYQQTPRVNVIFANAGSRHGGRPQSFLPHQCLASAHTYIHSTRPAKVRPSKLEDCYRRLFFLCCWRWLAHADARALHAPLGPIN